MVANLVLQLLSKDESFDEEITKDNVTQAKIQNWHVENLQQKHIKLHKRRKELKAKMKEIEGELGDVTKEIETTTDLLKMIAQNNLNNSQLHYISSSN
ncbi:hypothetical protein ES332_A13G012400v1 [Gossypium tomentosum]|uniref:Uncharacterized protein n=1 Tax=Gossypium tomentosum TaxID=34277 RepID=A0A5D2MEN1_GOSTO|nr:hypothetical protein ES332_A13G012400v1 [Gossypium tomentosum]